MSEFFEDFLPEMLLCVLISLCVTFLVSNMSSEDDAEYVSYAVYDEEGQIIEVFSTDDMIESRSSVIYNFDDNSIIVVNDTLYYEHDGVVETYVGGFVQPIK